MGKNLKKVIFSVLLLAAVIVVSPKDAKAAGKVWMAGFNDNSITIQWTPLQSDSFKSSPRVKPWVFTSDLPYHLRTLYTQ